MKRTWFALISICHLSLSCGNSVMEAANTKVTTQIVELQKNDITIGDEDIQQIKAKYHKVTIDGQANQNEFFSAENILAKINPWFQLGRGLQKSPVTISGYQFLVLEKMPASLLNDLQKRLDQNTYSLGILTSRFWKYVEQAQNRGLTLGFLTDQSPNQVSGVYFDQLGLIGIGVLNSDAVLVHELHHHEQFNAVRESGKTRPVSINTACLNNISARLGEIDAVRVEIPFFNGIEKEIPRLNRQAAFKIGDDTFPQLQLLMIALNYPVDSALYITKDENCDTSTREIFLEIYNDQLARKEDLLQAFTTHYTSLMSLARLTKKWNAEKCDSSPSEDCTHIAGEMKTTEEQFEIQQANFAQVISKDGETRTSILKKILEKMSPAEQQDLCNHALGAKFILNCK